MGLRIQNNIAALNAHKNLTISDSGLSKSLERLSSGYRINRAADDAAGLAISQGMRADIASYNVASRNASEANSLLQVAEGAMDQIGNMLTRLKELATQASSANAATNLDKIDAEAQKLIEEIDRIAESTEYSGTKLINGAFGTSIASSTANATSTSMGFVGISGMKAGETYTISDTVVDTDGVATITITTGSLTEVVTTNVATGDNTKAVEFSNLGVTLTVNSAFDTSAELEGSITASSTGSSSFQVGAENTGTSRIAISLGDATKDALGMTSGSTAISAIDLLSASSAQTALDIVDNAITDLTKVRGDIGAAQNRLGYATANLATTIENVTAAESVIRDVDMAAEMTTFTKNQILLQAGTAMLAQANMAPQGVLSLFG
jgi:flagellin